MKTNFDTSWKNWISTNINAGRDKDGIFKILLDEGYQYSSIVEEMKYTPDVDLNLIVNPLKNKNKSINEHANIHCKKIKVSQLFLPNAKKHINGNFEFYSIENFLSTSECKEMLAYSQLSNTQNLSLNHKSNKNMTPSGIDNFSLIHTDIIENIDSRICKIMGIDVSYSEQIQWDDFEESEKETPESLQKQSVYIFMIYLNDSEEKKFKSTKGTAVIWNSLQSDKAYHLHYINNEKRLTSRKHVVISKRFYSKSELTPAPPMYSKSINEFIPNYTIDGYFKGRYPEDAFKQIDNYFHENKKQNHDEYVPGGYIFNEDKGAQSSTMVHLPSELKNQIQAIMKPHLEAWSGTELEPTSVYGVRVYNNRTALKMHRDRPHTHIISVIINVDQEVNQPWPLVLEDNFYRQHHVLLKPGDMLFYEGARLIHGRPIPLDGKSYANIFCHFKPKIYIPVEFDN